MGDRTDGWQEGRETVIPLRLHRPFEAKRSMCEETEAIDRANKDDGIVANYGLKENK